MSRLAYLDCVSGVAGDMFLAALLDLGADRARLLALVQEIGLSGVELRIERTERHGIGATRVEVVVPEPQPPRPWREIRTLLTRSKLETSVRERSLEVFERLVQAEARVHRVPTDDVHLHELGSVDALVDVCGVVTLLADLGVDRLACSPLPVGRGFVRAAHGVLPLPAPATAELLRGLPVVGVGIDAELVTPTGAALVATLASEFGPLPALTLDRVGNGAGARDLPERPNLVRVFLGEAALTPAAPHVVCVETNLDDLVPELVPDAIERCFEAGALDVWTTPVQMKKGRPGFTLTALARPAAEEAVAQAMLTETSALGVRVSRLHRYELERELRQVELPGGSVRVKLGRLGGRIVNVAPEHDDCAALARKTGRSVKAVWAAAIGAVEMQ